MTGQGRWKEHGVPYIVPKFRELLSTNGIKRTAIFTMLRKFGILLHRQA